MLNEMTHVITEEAKLIAECVANYDYEKSKDYFKRIKEFERRGDRTLTQIFEALNTTFITPFDREDIHDLANMLDDIADYINNCAKRIVLYHPKKIPISALQLAQLLIKAANNLSNAIKNIDNLKKHAAEVKEWCNELHFIENQADDIYEMFVRELFENETDAIEVIKLKEIVHELEDAADAVEDAGNIIKTIIVKYA